MSDLTDFLLARIAEDEEAAFDAPEIADHNPRRILAECAAKRRIVEWATPTIAHADAELWNAGEAAAAEHVLALLALPYADHPACREEWRP